MKTNSVAAIVAASVLIVAGPAAAANLEPARIGLTGDAQAGAFAGFRLRLSLGEAGREPRLRGGFAIAPTLHSQADRGALRMRLGEGVEFGFQSAAPVGFSIAGTALGGGRSPAGQSAGASHLRGSTARILIIGGIAVLAAGAALFWHALDEASE